jgi:phosphoribosyl 1,2-cyclic phosphodiesterase
MILRNLGSGSGGNATVIAHEGRAILIDAGLGKRRILRGLDGLTLEGVLITHRHSDHLGRDAQKLGAPLWIEKHNWKAARRLGWIDDNVRHFTEAPFELGPFRITAFPLPHPGDERWNSYGFRVECGGRRLSYATDLGSVTAEVVGALSGADVVFLESNHDEDLEASSGRPPGHIDWVLSDSGHLSNAQCAEALAHAASAHTVILGHLSRDCNTPELALDSARRSLPPSTRLLAACQSQPTEDVTV